MASQPLTREMVAGLLETGDLELRNTALEIVARHPGRTRIGSTLLGVTPPTFRKRAAVLKRAAAESV